MQPPFLQVAIGSDVLVQCPYLDCSRTYRVRRRDFRCRIVRCGAALCRGREYQLPKHGTREQVRNWLQESWGWDDWNLGIILQDLYLFFFPFVVYFYFYFWCCFSAQFAKTSVGGDVFRVGASQFVWWSFGGSKQYTGMKSKKIKKVSLNCLAVPALVIIIFSAEQHHLSKLLLGKEVKINT